MTIWAIYNFWSDLVKKGVWWWCTLDRCPKWLFYCKFYSHIVINQLCRDIHNWALIISERILHSNKNYYSKSSPFPPVYNLLGLILLPSHDITVLSQQFWEVRFAWKVYNIALKSFKGYNWDCARAWKVSQSRQYISHSSRASYSFFTLNTKIKKVRNKINVIILD